MKVKVLTKVNMFIGLMLGIMGFCSCERTISGEYSVVKYGVPVDTTAHRMYGVPSPELDNIDE